jgi:YD repeat-containing protein
MSAIRCTRVTAAKCSYDSRDRVTQIWHKTSGGTSIVKETYSWGNSGDLTSKTIGSNTVSYTYDAIDQLLSETQQLSLSLTHL